MGGKKVDKTVPIDRNIMETLTGEFMFSEAVVDRDKGIIRNVALLGQESRNGRYYSDQAMDDYIGLVKSNRKIFLNHTNEPGKTRPVQEFLGVARSPRREGNRVFGDIEVIQTQRDFVFALAEQFSSEVGLSIDARAKLIPQGHTDGELDLVERMVALSSTDLVSDAASVQGLFEAKERAKEEDPMKDALMKKLVDLGETAEELEKLSDEELLELYDEKLKVQKEGEGDEKEKEAEKEAAEKEAEKEAEEKGTDESAKKDKIIDGLTIRVEELEKKGTDADKLSEAKDAIADAGISKTIADDLFIKHYSEANVEDRKHMLERGKRISDALGDSVDFGDDRETRESKTGDDKEFTDEQKKSFVADIKS